MKKFFPRLLLALATLPLLAACTFISVQNVTESAVRVRVQPPDSFTASTRNIESFGVEEVFSSYGGSYTVQLLPSAEYEAALRNLQTLITQRLFEEGATLSAAEVQQLTENLNQIDALIEDLAEPMPSCRGSVPDFETASAIISYDPDNSTYILTCQ